MEKNILRDSILETLRSIDVATNKAEKDLAQYIKENFGGRIDFNDETSYPTFRDDSEEDLQSVVAVKIGDNDEILFNTDFVKDENGNEVVDEKLWFYPRHYGEFDIFNLADVVFGIE